jgi:lipoate-protein ligase A
MAWDQQLLDWQIAQGGQNWLLRFYDWSPSALSIGYHQCTIPPLWQELVTELGLDLVRRPSGGRAVLHSGCLTYALICPQVHSSRSTMYAYLCQFLRLGLGKLGIQLTFGQGMDYSREQSCFHSHTRADLIMANGQKLIGSAQLYRRGSMLQHGSIMLQPNRDWLQRFFGDSQCIGAIADLDQFCHQSLAELQQCLISALTQSAEEHFLVEFKRREFSELAPCLISPKPA